MNGASDALRQINRMGASHTNIRWWNTKILSAWFTLCTMRAQCECEACNWKDGLLFHRKVFYIARLGCCWVMTGCCCRCGCWMCVHFFILFVCIESQMYPVPSARAAHRFIVLLLLETDEWNMWMNSEHWTCDVNNDLMVMRWACTFCQMISETKKNLFPHTEFMRISVISHSSFWASESVWMQIAPGHRSTHTTRIQRFNAESTRMDITFCMRANRKHSSRHARLYIRDSERDKCIM